MKRLLLFIIVISYCACAPKIIMQEAYLLDNEANEQHTKNRVDIQTYYIGDAYDYITFQIDIDNRSSDTIVLNNRNITLFLDDAAGQKATFYPIEKEEFIYGLNSDAHQLNQEKKANTTANIFLSGLDILGAVLSGANAAETMIYSTGTAIDILDNRRGYEEAQMSVEEQIAYHENYTLDVAVILPGESGTYDIHFSRLMVDGYCELEIFCAEHNYIFEYDLEVIETRIR